MEKITIKNYEKAIKNIDFSKMPKAIQEGNKGYHSYLEFYDTDDDMKNIVDLYLKTLNDFLSKKATKKIEKPKKVKEEAKITLDTFKSIASKCKDVNEFIKKVHKIEDVPPKVSKEFFDKYGGKETSDIQEASKNFMKEFGKKVKAKKTKNINFVEKLTDEQRIIKRYTLLNNKTKMKRQVLSFIKYLQKAIIEKRVSKTSEHANIINDIQKQIVDVYNKMGNEVKFEFDNKRLEQLKSIANNKIKLSVTYIKRFISIYGRENDVNVRKLFDLINKALKSGKIKENDKYINEIKNIKKELKNYIDNGEIKISEQTLNGLENIVKKKRNVRDIITSNNFVKKTFSPLGFSGQFLQIIGNPVKPFSMMVYGKPGSGKSTFMLDFAKYLCKKNFRVLFVADEEKFNYTLQEKIKRLHANSDNLFLSEKIPDYISDYNFVFLDSVTSLELMPSDIKKLRNKYKQISFIYSLQSTKDGNFRGVSEFEHDVDVSLEAKKGEIFTKKSRFGGNGVAKIY